jgi:hypothetical protein
MIDGLRACAWVFDGNANSWSTLDLGEAWSVSNAPFEHGRDERIDAAYYHPATDRLTVVRGTNAYVQSVASGTWRVEDLRVTWADGPFADGVTTPIDDAYFYAGHDTVTVTRDGTAWVYSFDTHVWTTVDLEQAWAGPNNPFETTYRIDSAFAGPGNRLTVTRGRAGFSFNFGTATWDPPFKLSQVMTGAGSPPYPQMGGGPGRSGAGDAPRGAGRHATDAAVGVLDPIPRAR